MERYEIIEYMCSKKPRFLPKGITWPLPVHAYFTAWLIKTVNERQDPTSICNVRPLNEMYAGEWSWELRYERPDATLSQWDLARAAGVKVSSVSRLEVAARRWRTNGRPKRGRPVPPYKATL